MLNSDGPAPWVGTTDSVDGVYTLPLAKKWQAYTIPSEAQRPRMVSQTIIQDAIVLWVGTILLRILKP